MSDKETSEELGKAFSDHKRLKEQLVCLKSQGQKIRAEIERGLSVIDNDQVKARTEPAFEIDDEGAFRSCQWPTSHDIAEFSQKRENTQKQLEEVEKLIEGMGYRNYLDGK